MKAISTGAMIVATITVVGIGVAADRDGAVAGEPQSVATRQYPGGSSRSAFRSVNPYETHSFYFTRAIYGGGGNFRGSAWMVDYPDADRWIANVLGRLTGIDVSPNDNLVQLDDPNLRRFPFIYAVEVGSMGLSPAEVQGLRSYLLAGGFLMADDFWGQYEWENFEYEMRQVLPEYEIVDIPLDHELFRSYYAIDEIVQVPNIGNGIDVGYGFPGARTWERDGIVPHCRGIFDEEGRLMVVINWNTDLGDAWEHAEDSRYPLQYSTYAYQMAANFIVYAMTH